MKLIDKDALVAEINRQHKILMQTDHTYGAQFVLGFRQACRQIIDFLDTLEVKEVDLEKELDKEWNKCEPTDEGMGLEIASIEHEQFDNIAKHFYELGLKAQKKE